MAKDYYDILGVDRKASPDEIKKAFHKLAHKYHPDKKGGDEAKFKEVNEAYQTLSDESKRREYDTYGQTFNGQGGPGFQGGFNGFEGVDLGDIFNDFFGGGFGGFSEGRNRVERGSDISVDMELSFTESMYGATRKIVLNKTNTCGTCAGSGAKPGTKMKDCATCNGKGKVNEMRKSVFGTFSTVRVCDQCHGSGKLPEDKCKDCHGQGIVKKPDEIVINVPLGIRDGEVIRMTGKGEAVAHGIPGDLYIRVHVKPHSVFTREGDNLVMTLNIKITDAILGAQYTITDLENRSIEVKIPEGVKYGDILRLKEKGAPTQRGKRGDIMIHVNINTPQRLSSKAKKLIEELKQEGI